VGIDEAVMTTGRLTRRRQFLKTAADDLDGAVVVADVFHWCGSG
jgi:hypothetical protein